jgi:hypothetical protein
MHIRGNNFSKVLCQVSRCFLRFEVIESGPYNSVYRFLMRAHGFHRKAAKNRPSYPRMFICIQRKQTGIVQCLRSLVVDTGLNVTMIGHSGHTLWELTEPLILKDRSG